MRTQKMKKVLYTCITGDYDQVPEHKYVDQNWDYILFTDKKDLVQRGQIYHWQVRELPFTRLSNAKNSRYPKLNPHLVLPDYDYSLYMDANIVVNSAEFFAHINTHIDNGVLVAIPLHGDRSCIYRESEIIVEWLIERKKVVEAQMAFLRKEGFPEGYGLHENCLILRRHNDDRLVAVQELWWKMLTKFSRRDQLSGMYSFWKNGVEITPLYSREKGYHRKCEELSFIDGTKHCRRLGKKVPLLPSFMVNIMCLLIPGKERRSNARNRLRSITRVKYNKG